MKMHSCHARENVDAIFTVSIFQTVEIESQDLAGITVMRLTGQLDMDSCLQVQRAVQRSLQPRIIINMAHIKFIDSAGIGALVSAARTKGNDLNLCEVTTSVRRILELTKIDNIFKMYPTESDAIRAFSG